MIKSIDRDACRLIREKLDPQLVQLGKDLGINIRVTGGTFGPSNVTFKVEAAVISDGGLVMTKEASDFQKYARQYDLDPNMLNTTFVQQDRIYKIIGLKARARTHPILAETGGKVYKFGALVVLNAILKGRREANLLAKLT